MIGLERQLRHKPAGLRTNMFICFGAAMFTVLSRQLAGVESDSARIAAQIIPGIGFIGAGSILHAKTSVTGLTTAATLFVVASVGMAAGGGLYLTAIFATGMILIALVVLGRLELTFSLKAFTTTYEVTGRNVDGTVARGQSGSRSRATDYAHSSHRKRRSRFSGCVLGRWGARATYSILDTVTRSYGLFRRHYLRHRGTRMKASPGKKPLSVPIPFTKASACGNDFLLVESQLVSGDLKSLSRNALL